MCVYFGWIPCEHLPLQSSAGEFKYLLQGDEVVVFDLGLMMLNM